jgi:hypothetical protein
LHAFLKVEKGLKKRTFLGKLLAPTPTTPKKVIMESSTKETQTEQTEQAKGKIIHLGHLLRYLGQVKDGRKRRGKRYSLEVILTLFILGKLCGQNKVYGIADWAQQQSEYLNGPCLGIEVQTATPSQYLPVGISR